MVSIGVQEWNLCQHSLEHTAECVPARLIGEGCGAVCCDVAAGWEGGGQIRAISVSACAVRPKKPGF